MTTKDTQSSCSKIARAVLGVPKSGIRDFFDIVATRDDIISLGIGEPDFDTPKHIRAHAIKALEKGGLATSYTSNLGQLELRQALVAYVKKTFNIEYDAETEVLVAVGVSEAMDLAVRAILNPGEEVLYHEPCFVSYAPVVTFAGGVPVPVPTSAENGFRITPEALRKKVTDKTKALLLSYPNNPTGAILPLDEVKAVADFVQEHDLLVICDDIYAELTYDVKHVSIASLPGMRERTIFLHGFSKAWAMTGFRMGYACAPPEFTEAMMKIHQYTMMSAPTLSQIASCEALTTPEADIKEMHGEYQRRRDFLVGAFDEMDLPCIKPQGAFYAFPDISSCGLSSFDFAMKFLADEDVAVVPGTAFGEAGEGYVRCAYATSMPDLKEAMIRLKRFVEKLRR